MLEGVGRLGFRVELKTAQFLGMLYLAIAAWKGAWLERRRGRRLIARTIANQIYFTAVEPLPFFALTALVFGFAVIYECDTILPRYGLQYLVPDVIVTGIVREIAPLVVAMVLIGRSGPAIASELGYMRLNQEIDALDVVGVNIEYYIVFPRIIGVALATVLGMVTFCAVAIAGGFLVGEVAHVISMSLLFRSLVDALALPAIGYALLKAAFFGTAIAVSNCYHGLSVAQSFTEIPKANVRGVQHSLLFCFFANALISVYAIL
jgi:phospholipid/cholesterol/gamma-HCH transport system permease protein